jgi:hypothetical protein
MPVTGSAAASPGITLEEKPPQPTRAISPKTCDHHIQNLYRKIGVGTRAGATMFAVAQGLLAP